MAYRLDSADIQRCSICTQVTPDPPHPIMQSRAKKSKECMDWPHKMVLISTVVFLMFLWTSPFTLIALILSVKVRYVYTFLTACYWLQGSIFLPVKASCISITLIKGSWPSIFSIAYKYPEFTTSIQYSLLFPCKHTSHMFLVYHRYMGLNTNAENRVCIILYVCTL